MLNFQKEQKRQFNYININESTKTRKLIKKQPKSKR